MSTPKHTTKKPSSYLEDGLYAQDEGFQFRLYADRGFQDGVHEVFLEDNVLMNFFEFIERTRGVKIIVEKTKAGA